MEEKTLVIMNEQHSLLPQQKELIKKELGAPMEFLRVPADGWSKEQILSWVKEIEIAVGEGNLNIVVLSPIPLLLASLSMLQGSGKLWDSKVFVLHNDRREKKELPNGKVISTVAQEGWELIDIESIVNFEEE